MNNKRKILITSLSLCLIGGSYYLTINNNSNKLDINESVLTFDLNEEIKKPKIDYKISYDKDSKPVVELSWKTETPNEKVNVYRGKKLIYSGTETSFIDKEVKDSVSPPKPRIAHVKRDNSGTKANVQLSKLEDEGKKYDYKIEVFKDNKKYVSEEKVEVKGDLKLFSDNGDEIKLSRENSFDIDLIDGEIPDIKLNYYDNSKNSSSKLSLKSESHVLNEGLVLESITRSTKTSIIYDVYNIDFKIPEGGSAYGIKMRVLDTNTLKYVDLPVTNISQYKYSTSNTNGSMIDGNKYSGEFQFKYSDNDKPTVKLNTSITVEDNGTVNLLSTVDRKSYYSELGDLYSTYNFSLIMSDMESNSITYNTGYNDSIISYEIYDNKNKKQLKKKGHVNDGDDRSKIVIDDKFYLSPLSSEYKVTSKFQYRLGSSSFLYYPQANAEVRYYREFITPYEFDNIAPDITLRVESYKDTHMVEVEAYDSNTGLSHLIIKPTEEKIDIVDMTYNYKEKIRLPGEGTYIFQIYDMAGNMSQQQITVFDSPNTIEPPGGNLPDIIINKTPNEDWTNGPVDITIVEKTEN